MTFIESVRQGTRPPSLLEIAIDEGLTEDLIASLVLQGKIIVPHNPRHSVPRALGIGQKLRTKVNVNLGTSADFPDLAPELEKLRISLEYQTDTVMDLGTGGDIKAIRRQILKNCTVPLGTVPIYQAALQAIERRGSIVDMTEDDLFAAIEAQAEEGVDFMTVHCGLTSRAIERLKHQGRVADIVSRGGAFHLAWMIHNQKENPLYSRFDRLLELARKYDFTLSLGDALRPGSVLDATDKPQIEELMTLGELVKRAWKQDVQVMVEGPGHVPLNQVELNIRLQKQVCYEAPFYVLGPLVTDIAPGYDHITAAIGGAIAAAAGADFLCYVTPAEHLGLPSPQDVREGLIASRIAAHAADIVKGVPGAIERDLKMSRARKRLDWAGQKAQAIDPERFDQVRGQRKTKSEACSMCGEYCAMRIVSEFLDPEGKARDFTC
jgi:phosphomethylpyrimidine synthase